ncbi:uncharacterized protein LOC104444069 isoform X2 [Eucalyptus grandis]|uniref:uncharacterized protein LOC104444069 isoform X2 n=1 Tax=Eucalyptus grandis TaxID=71139 RepID=UPI00192E9060|nr:uncharacterized protein LOC104444069 isoform X2 [Eucalyptus grandis]
MRSLRNAVGREKDKVVAVRRKENDKEKRIPRNLSGREESLQTIKAAATSKGNCNLDKRNIEAQPADLGCNQAIKRFPGVLCPKVQQAPEHEEETCNESYPALLNSAKDDGNIPEFISDNGKQTTNAATTNKGNCNFDKRKMEARPTNLGSHQAIRQSPRVLHPEFQKAPEHEEDTCNESYLALLNGAKNVSYILESKSDNGKQNTKAAAASKRNCSLDKRNIDAQPTNLGSTQATRWSPKVLRPEVQQAPEHEEETWDESYLAVLSCAKEDGSIIEFTSANGKQTTNAATTNKGNCNFDKRKMEARPANLGSNQAIRQSPRVLHPEFQKATEHEEDTCNESYLALLNGAKNVSYILESKSDNGKQNTKAAAASKRNCSLDKRTIDAQPTNLGSTQATRWSPKVLRPEVQQAPEHEEETWDESYLAVLSCAKEDGSIIEFTSANGKQTTNAATTNKGNCNFDKRKMEARPANLGSNQAIRQSPRVLHPEFQKATEHEEHTCNESYLALLNGAKNVSYILESKSDNGKQNTKAAAASKRNCSLDKRTIDAQPANLGSTWATRWSPKVLRPEVQQAPEHEEETWDESYLAILHCAKEDGSIIEFTSANGKQIRYEEDDEEDDEESSCEVEMLAGEDISKCEEFVTRKLSKDPITVDSKHFADDPGSSSGTVFRKKLMGVLKMPYDVKEHEDLSRRVRHKRQKTVEKSLRQGRDFTSSLRQRCKSYLELHKDLATELKLVRADFPRNLNLLRGFFFWLEMAYCYSQREDIC